MQELTVIEQAEADKHQEVSSSNARSETIRELSTLDLALIGGGTGTVLLS
jgi:hypothetical protein